MEGFEITEGRKIRFGTVAELKTTKSEWKASNNFVQPKINRPPGAGAVRGRGRGKVGLGFRPATARKTEDQSGQSNRPMSNQGFRDMLLGKGTKQVAEKDAEKDTAMEG